MKRWLCVAARTTGALFLLFSLIPSEALALLPRALFAPVGTYSDNLGYSVSPAGDVNGDGYSDVIAGAPYGSTEGQAYVYYGGPNADGVADLTLTGEAPGDYFGSSVSSAGDVNGDGYSDVIVGASFAGPGGTMAGRAYVFYGGPSADAIADLTLFGESANDLFGFSVSGAGDVNGDGYDDVIVGSWFNDAGGPIDDDRGRAYVYFGGPGADNVADLTFTGEAAGDELGSSVSDAGDVNGDGYADVIVGAPFNDAGGVAGDNRGRAYVFYGGPTADSVADLTLTGSAAGDGFGNSVAAAGDVNGDGHADLIVGARNSDYGDPNAGGAFVYFGGPGADTVADLELRQNWPDSGFGMSVSGAGDMNGDGYDDVIVGTHYPDNAYPGRAYVYYGGGPLLDTIYDQIFMGEAPGDKFGLSVAGAGDVDGDGFDDVVVGAYRNDAGGTQAGRVYVYSVRPYKVLAPNGGEQWVAGRTESIRWLGADLADLWISFDGGASYSLLLQGVGGGERNELSVVAPTVPSEGVRVRVSISGSSTTFAHCDESDGVFRIVSPRTPPAAAHRLAIAPTGVAAGDSFGGSVSRAGDVNGDGYDDLIVGAYANDSGGANAGQAYVYFGGPETDVVPDVTLTGQAAGDFFGASVSGAGDVNGDGYDDVIVGARLNDAGGADAGRAYVYHGGPAMDGVADLILTGEAAGDFFGTSVASAGDVNGDGFDDVIVGANGNDAGGAGAGRAYVFYGGVVGDAATDLTLTGEAAGNFFGQAVSGAGDVNGDGYDDVTVGAQFNSAGGTSAGRAYVYLGGPGADANADLTFTGQAATNYLGYSVSGAGDVNGDGYDDVIVGAYGNSAGGAGTGQAYVFLGGPGADARPDLTLTGEAAGDNFGASVSDAGDVNGDGYGDLIVGAWTNDAGGANGGRAYVYYGGASPDAVADVVWTSEAPGDRLGHSVSAAGDVNGDGHDDVLVGAYQNDGGGANAGRAYVYDFNRYFVLSPNGGETWNVGASRSISWLGAEPADVWLSVDGGSVYTLLESGVGGGTSNSLPLRVPHSPTKFARVKVTAHDGAVGGSDKSDSLFTIESSVALLNLTATLGEGGAELSWSTDPGVGPEGLAGYRLERASGGGASSAWHTIAALTREISVTDPDGGPGSRYRLFAVNGLGEELWLGEAALRPLAPIAAWPLPYRRGDLTISFATAGGLGGSAARAELAVYDVQGRLVRRIDSGVFPAGYRIATWDGRDARGRDVATGVYFIRTTGELGYGRSTKVTVLR